MSSLSNLAAIGGLLFGGGLLTPGTALGAPEVPSGPYEVTAQHRTDGDALTQTWTFTPCGPSCIVGDDVFTERVEYHLNNGRWAAHTQNPESPCPVGGTVPRTIDSSFDAVTLAGEWQATLDGQCGERTGILLGPWDFQLTKAG